jgi:hypothetical protein
LPFAVIGGTGSITNVAVAIRAAISWEKNLLSRSLDTASTVIERMVETMCQVTSVTATNACVARLAARRLRGQVGPRSANTVSIRIASPPATSRRAAAEVRPVLAALKFLTFLAGAIPLVPHEPADRSQVLAPFRGHELNEFFRRCAGMVGIVHGPLGEEREGRDPQHRRHQARRDHRHVAAKRLSEA